MPKITTIFFDNDGVLVDTEKLFCESNQALCDEMNISHTKKDFQHYQQTTNIGTAGFLEKFKLTTEEIKLFKEKRNTLWRDKVELGQHLIPEAETTLKKLSKTYRLCLTTSAPRIHYELAHKASNMLPLFEEIIGREECSVIKPHPNIYLKAIKLMQVKPEESIVVEDSPRGIEAAQRAGLRVIAVRNHFFLNLDISNADYILEGIKELPRLLETLQKTAHSNS